ncbi:MAG: glycosyltransferase family 2 protein [Pseudomonadota bacterium]
MRLIHRLRERISLRLERRSLQVRALLKGRELECIVDRTDSMPPGPILVSTVRNEAVRLPHFIDHYRNLGIVHFLIVDNGSGDETPAILEQGPDISVWRTEGSYKASRFGVDWVNALLARHGAGRWIVVADPDELLIYPHHDTRRLPALTRWLEAQGRESFPTMLLDLYGDRPVRETFVQPGGDPVEAAPWFDAFNYTQDRNWRYHNLWIQGGPRQRIHFTLNPREAPALNKIPLVRWRKGFVYKTSTHNLLPRRLNRTYATTGAPYTSGVLLHTKFTHVLDDKVREEMERRQHYDDSAEYRAYAARGGDVCLWSTQSMRYQNWQQLQSLGLMSDGGWH